MGRRLLRPVAVQFLVDDLPSIAEETLKRPD
jgi:hypothetical protein